MQLTEVLKHSMRVQYVTVRSSLSLQVTAQYDVFHLVVEDTELGVRHFYLCASLAQVEQRAQRLVGEFDELRYEEDGWTLLDGERSW